MGRSSKPAAVLVATSLLIVGGGAYALGSSSDGTITVCVNHKTGVLYKAKKCARRDAKLSWNQRGTLGPQGMQGPKGDAGPAGANAVSVTSQTLPTGDTHCPNGGSSFTTGTGTTYACNGGPGSALAYAHVTVSGGTPSFDTPNTKGMGAATVTLGNPSGFCFSGLPFTPHNATVTIDANNSQFGSDVAQVALAPPGEAAPGCSPGQNVGVYTVNANTNNSVLAGFYITFN